MEKVKVYNFVFRYWDIPMQKYKRRAYLIKCKYSVLTLAKELVTWFKGFPRVRDVTLTVYDFDNNIVAEV